MPSTTWRSQLSDALLTRLWPVPLLGVVFAIGAGLVVPELDRAIGNARLHVPLLSGSTADDARELLGTITTAMMTVTSLTFSLTVVTLQLASGQYSPRLLRTFARDRFVQTTMALFLATFAYALTVLKNIQNGPHQSAHAVPHIAVSIAATLALLSVVGLVFFLAHLVAEIRVETMMHTVCADALSAGSETFRALESKEDREPIPRPPARAALIAGRSSGFLVSIDEGTLLSAALGADAVVLVNRAPGDWLVEGDPVAFAWALDPSDTLEDDRLRKVTECAVAALRTGNERTPVQDVGYGLRQLTDLAVKALSPGVNDPTTAVHALGYSSTLLCHLARRRLHHTVLCRDDVPRAIIRQPTFGDLLNLAVAQPRRYGADDPAVLGRLLTLLREVAWQTRNPEHRCAIEDQLSRLRGTIAAQNFHEAEINELGALERDVEAVLAGDWRPEVQGGC